MVHTIHGWRDTEAAGGYRDVGNKPARPSP
jgi:hypothetical protein